MAQNVCHRRERESSDVTENNRSLDIDKFKTYPNTVQNVWHRRYREGSDVTEK